MDHGEPGLFDLPEPETTTTTTPSRTQTGRNRQTWTLTVTADVSIVDAAAVAGATERYLADTVVIDAHTGSVIEDPAPEDAGPDPTHATLDQLRWLIDPTEGLGQLMEQGALFGYGRRVRSRGVVGRPGLGHLERHGETDRCPPPPTPRDREVPRGCGGDRREPLSRLATRG